MGGRLRFLALASADLLDDCDALVMFVVVATAVLLRTPARDGARAAAVATVSGAGLASALPRESVACGDRNSKRTCVLGVATSPPFNTVTTSNVTR